jgi:hypothetical protein
VQRPATGGLEPRLAVTFTKPQDAKAGPEALLRMAAAGEDLADQLARGRAGLLGPLDESSGCPLGVLAMRPWHVRGNRRMPTRLIGPPVTGDALATVQDLHGLRGDARLDLESDELIGDGVIVAFELDVIVDC